MNDLATNPTVPQQSATSAPDNTNLKNSNLETHSDSTESHRQQEAASHPSTVKLEDKPVVEHLSSTITTETTTFTETITSEHHDAAEESQDTSLSHQKQVKNPFGVLAPKVTHLVYWENPVHSAAVPAISLSFLLFTSYLSLFNIFCAAVVTFIGLNWVYVLGRKQIYTLLNQEPVNPHEHLLAHHPWYIERVQVDKYLDVTIDGVNYILQESQKIILVDDSLRSIKYVVLFYVLWTLGTWFTFRTLLGIGLALGFTLPKAYLHNKAVVDERLGQVNSFLRIHLDRVLKLAKQHTDGIFVKGKSYFAHKDRADGKKALNISSKETAKEE